MDADARRTRTLSLLALLGAIVGGAYGRWAEAAGFALSAVSWGFSVALLPLAVPAGLALGWRDGRLAAARLAATAQAAMTLAFCVFAFALRTSPPEMARIPWQVLVVLLGDVVVTTAGLSVAAAAAAWALASWRERPRA